jgi:hypothetical protein
MTRGDKFLLAGLICVSLILLATLYSRFSPFSNSAAGLQAVISVRGKIIKRVVLPVSGRSTVTVPGLVGSSTVELEGGRVRMRNAPCNGRICVNQGWIRLPGQSIVCIPGEILIRIEGSAPLDGVTR